MIRRFLIVLGICVFHVSPVFAQTQPASPTPTAQPSSAAVSPTPANGASADDHNLREGLKGMADDSKTLTGWALAIIAASIVAIASTSYLRPLSRKVRAIYLVFIPGWIFISLSVYYGDQLSRGYTAAIFARSRDRLLAIGLNMNIEFGSQLTYLNIAFMVFAVWLLAFILWWVFGDSKPSTSNTSGGN
jgi:hypothetical protein